ncbi:MAG: YceI family protein [Bacteroidota bacterium]|nr:YceI family protein [Bacteroidota bacterium]
MKKFNFLIIFVFVSQFLFSQDRFITRNGIVSFSSEAPLEKIEAINNKVSCVLDFKTGEIVFQIYMISFNFDKALMQEHFNEKYVESEIYPKSIFKGKIQNWESVNKKQGEKYNVKASGIIEIHGIKKEIGADGTLELINKEVHIQSDFFIRVSDFNIKVPRIVRNNIAKEVIINVDVTLNKM